MRLIYKQILLPIKLVSIVLILTGIGLELWNLSANFLTTQISNSLHSIIWFARFVVGAHLIEGIIAAYLAPRKNKIAFKYAAYTFFVGTVGLLELFDSENE
ncbi:MAG: hypothetical protein QNJ51_26985 [Calothrix sp. MO_167.B12]|nr:hypothetical protein [Calothrix sp. MO_167.B12]